MMPKRPARYSGPPLLINKGNRGAIEAALKKVNGKAVADTYTTYEQIRDVAGIGRSITKDDVHWGFITVCSISGRIFGNCNRIATRVVLQWEASGCWTLNAIERWRIDSTHQRRRHEVFLVAPHSGLVKYDDTTGTSVYVR